MPMYATASTTALTAHSSTAPRRRPRPAGSQRRGRTGGRRGTSGRRSRLTPGPGYGGSGGVVPIGDAVLVPTGHRVKEADQRLQQARCGGNEAGIRVVDADDVVAIDAVARLRFGHAPDLGSNLEDGAVGTVHHQPVDVETRLRAAHPGANEVKHRLVHAVLVRATR